MKRFLFFLMFVLSITLSAQEKRPITPEDLYEIKNLSDVNISPDGKWVAYTVSVPDLEANKYNSDIWLYPAGGGDPVQLTSSPASDFSPRWSPDGKTIAFISSRNGNADVYTINVNGGEAVQLTDAGHAINELMWFPDGDKLLCGSRVVPEGKTDIENRTKEDLPESEARTIDRLLFRQWDAWLGDKRNHLFVIDANTGDLEDVTPEDADVPPISLSGGRDFDVAPDGKEICYVKNTDELLAASTNNDIFLRNLETKEETKLTSNKAWDGNPHYSPDGRYIAYAAMTQPGYETDRKRLVLYDRLTGGHQTLTEDLDRTVDEIVWAHDSKKIFFNAMNHGRKTVYRTDLEGNISEIMNDGYSVSIALHPDDETLFFLRSYNNLPYELFTLPKGDKKAEQVTFTNLDFIMNLDLPVLEDFSYEGEDGDTVHGFIQLPPDFDPDKKYPVVLTIHGGPQNMWADRFMTRWFTFPLISSPGYVGVFINPRGSSGYGSEFREQISRNYGKYAYGDLMKGMDYVIENYDYIDETKQAAIGGSYGGYSVNWLMGKTDRFACIVSHAGLYNLTSFYGATEELWFPEWDMGKSPWEEPELYDKWSPHKYAANFSTPTLVTHGQMDFRVPFAESLQLFTALQRQGIDSRLVVFPDEGHVIYGPQNNVRWWKEIHRWFETYLK